MFNWIKELIQLEMTPRAHWGSFAVPIYITQCCHHHPLSLSPLLLAPGCSSPSPPAAEPFSTAHWACQSHLQGHTRLSADVNRVCTTKAKEGLAAKQLLILLQKQGSSLTLITVHSLRRGQPPSCCSG